MTRPNSRTPSGAPAPGSENVTGDAIGGMLQRIDERFTQEGLTFGIHNHYFKKKFPYESARRKCSRR